MKALSWHWAAVCVVALAINGCSGPAGDGKKAGDGKPDKATQIGADTKSKPPDKQPQPPEKPTQPEPPSVPEKPETPPQPKPQDKPQPPEAQLPKDQKEPSPPTQPTDKVGERMTKQLYGKMPDGTVVEQYTLSNATGVKVRIITYGGIITAVETPDRNGKLANITLYRDSLEDYLAGHPYFGCIVGRYANRIAKGRFVIDGVEYKLATNNGPNHLHGGIKGFDKYVWQASPIEGDGYSGLVLKHESPDGDEGYPGKLSVTVTYTLNDQNELKIEYQATTDKPTHVNLTNHAYWNLAGAGAGDILGHVLMLNADRFLPVDDTLIPLGEPRSVKDTPMDFTMPQPIGSRIDQVEGGYDHCYILRRSPEEKLALAARVVEPKSGRTMEIRTTKPAIQFYTGNFLDGSITAAGGNISYEKHYGFCLETEYYPDSPNRPEYPSTLLKPGETYHHITIHKFGVEN